MKKIYLFFLLWIFTLPALAETEVDSLLQVLDLTILNRQKYIDIKESHINGLQDLYKKPGNSAEQIYNINFQLYKEYEAYMSDSALYYIEKNLDLARQVNNPDWIYETKFLFSTALTASGLYKESIELLNTIEKTKLPPQFIADYYAAHEFVFSEYSYYTLNTIYSSVYEQQGKQYRDTLLSVLPPNSHEYMRHMEKVLLEKGQLSESAHMNELHLSTLEEGTRSYAKVTHQRAEICAQIGNMEEQKKFLILSAISDFKAAIKDNYSLFMLSSIFFEKGDINRAYEYIKYSLVDANYFNARLRYLQISKTQPIINKAYQVKNDQQKNALKSFLTLISLLSLLLLCAIIYIYKQIKKLSVARNKLEDANRLLDKLNQALQHTNTQQQTLNSALSEANHIKEEYISLFLSMCSTYIDKLENYRKMVNRKVAAGQIDELFKATKSPQLIDSELKEFYAHFDNTFLHLYPDFVNAFNALLQEDGKIILRKGEVLNTELRIFALIRLGITDSSRIAEFLRYSVNTIYTYRTKVKNKSAGLREEFENQVMKIGNYTNTSLPLL